MFVERYPLDTPPSEGIVPGAIKGAYANKQPGYAEEELPDDDPELLAYADFLKTLKGR